MFSPRVGHTKSPRLRHSVHKIFIDLLQAFQRVVRQLTQANENLTGNILKTILTANKVKEQNMCA